MRPSFLMALIAAIAFVAGLGITFLVAEYIEPPMPMPTQHVPAP
jgi:hypothetical protein